MFIVGITLTLIAFLGLPLGFPRAPLGMLFLWWMPDHLPAFVRLFWLWSSVVFAFGLVIIVVGTSASSTLCALAIALVALAATARPFIAPHICGMVALITSFIGFTLAIYDGRLRDRANEPVYLLTLSVTANALVALLSALLLTRAIQRHIIDIFERGYDGVLTAIGLAPLVALVLLVAACLQAGRRGQRIVEGQSGDGLQ